MRAFPDLPGGRRSEFIDCPRGTSVELDSLRPGLIVPFFETPLVGIERVPNAPTSCLLVLHGLAEHCGRYVSTMESLAVSASRVLPTTSAATGARRDAEATSNGFPNSQMTFARFARESRQVFTVVAREVGGWRLIGRPTA